MGGDSHLDPSTALVPNRSSGTRKSIVYTFGMTLLFVAITSIIVFAKGTNHYMRGFIFVGIALVVLFVSTALLLNFVRTDDSIDEKVRYFAVFQSVSLALLCISLLVVVFEPSQPIIQPEPVNTCDLTAPSMGGCFANNAQCFNSTQFSQPIFFHVNATCPCAFVSQWRQCARG